MILLMIFLLPGIELDKVDGVLVRSAELTDSTLLGY